MAGRYTPTYGGYPVLTAGDLANLWVDAGGPANVARIAGAIGYAESRGQSREQIGGGVSVPLSQTGWGYWQITPGDSSLLNPLANAKAAVAKYRAAGNSFSPWVTYQNGTYKQYLKQGSVLPGAILLGLLGLAAAPGAVGALGATEGAAATTGEAAATGGTAGGLGGLLSKLGSGGLSALGHAKAGFGLAALVSVLLDPKHILRALMVVGGIALILIALVYMVKSQALKG